MSKNLAANHPRVNPWLIFNLSWIFLLVPTLVHSVQILRSNCSFFDSYLTCSAHPSVLENILNSSFFLIFLIAVTWSYFKIIKTGATLKQILQRAWPALLAAFLLAPWGSFDSFYYRGVANVILSGHNPYFDALHRVNPFAATLGDIQPGGVVYQPIWLALTAALTWLAHGSILLGIYLFKLLALGSHLALAALLIRLARHLKISDKALPAAYLLNPLILFEFLGQGHFDILMMCFVIGALIFLFSRKLLLSSLSLAAAFNIKLTALAFLPLIAFYIWNTLGMPGLLRLAFTAIPFLAFTVILYAPFWRGLDTLSGLKWQSKWIANSLFSGVYSAIGLVLQKLGRLNLLDHQVPRILTFLFLLPPLATLLKWHQILWAWITRRQKMSIQDFLNLTVIALMIYVLVIQRSYWPWYLALIFPVALLLNPQSLVRKLVLWLTISALAYYVFYLLVGYIAVSDLWAQVV